MLPSYRREVFDAGLRRLGYEMAGHIDRVEPDDLLIVWNRNGSNNEIAQGYLDAGARVIVAENGYIGTDAHGHRLYAMALDHHNGAGRWRVGDDDRWARLNIPLSSWRADGDRLVVLPQRGIGAPGVAMPTVWPFEIRTRLRRATERPFFFRDHPGKKGGDPYEDLDGAWAAVTWGSGAAIKAIIAGIPVFHDFDRWIGASAATRGVRDIESPWMGDRLPMLRRLAWAQWSAAEIESGEPFKWLLES